MSRVARVRAFNRFYTQKIGVLDEGLLQSAYSLAEVRVLSRPRAPRGPTARATATATAIGRDLGLDAGYLSRLLRALVERGLVTRRPSPIDRRQSLLALSKKGRRVFADLDARSDGDVARLLRPLGVAGQQKLVAAMGTIETLLGDGAPPEAGAPYLLRGPQPGDLGWIVHRHGVLYAEEYGWDARFEGLVAGVVGQFVAHHDAARERCFIAERDGALVGSVLVVAQSKTVAKLRLLLVEPSARGLGIGERLVAECIRFAKLAGYRTLTLWTNSVLHAARRIYERAGFRLVAEAAHDQFGHTLVGQTWELRLSRAL